MTSLPLLTSSSSSSFYSLSCSCSCFRIRNDRQPFSCLMLDDASRLPTSHGHIRASLIVHKYIHILNLVNSKPPVTECIIILKILFFLFIQSSFRSLVHRSQVALGFPYEKEWNLLVSPYVRSAASPRSGPQAGVLAPAPLSFIDSEPSSSSSARCFFPQAYCTCRSGDQELRHRNQDRAK